MRFKLTGHVTVTAYTEIEADSEDEALAIAADREAAIGGVGSGADSDDQWIVDDVDGQIEEIRVEECEV